jgi:hypothetical protein
LLCFPFSCASPPTPQKENEQQVTEDEASPVNTPSKSKSRVGKRSIESSDDDDEADDSMASRLRVMLGDVDSDADDGPLGKKRAKKRQVLVLRKAGEKNAVQKAQQQKRQDQKERKESKDRQAVALDVGMRLRVWFPIASDCGDEMYCIGNVTEDLGETSAQHANALRERAGTAGAAKGSALDLNAAAAELTASTHKGYFRIHFPSEPEAEQHAKIRAVRTPAGEVGIWQVGRRCLLFMPTCSSVIHADDDSDGDDDINNKSATTSCAMDYNGFEICEDDEAPALEALDVKANDLEDQRLAYENTRGSMIVEFLCDVGSKFDALFTAVEGALAEQQQQQEEGETKMSIKRQVVLVRRLLTHRLGLQNLMYNITSKEAFEDFIEGVMTDGQSLRHEHAAAVAAEAALDAEDEALQAEESIVYVQRGQGVEEKVAAEEQAKLDAPLLDAVKWVIEGMLLALERAPALKTLMDSDADDGSDEEGGDTTLSAWVWSIHRACVLPVSEALESPLPPPPSSLSALSTWVVGIHQEFARSAPSRNAVRSAQKIAWKANKAAKLAVQHAKEQVAHAQETGTSFFVTDEQDPQFLVARPGAHDGEEEYSDQFEMTAEEEELAAQMKQEEEDYERLARREDKRLRREAREERKKEKQEKKETKEKENDIPASEGKGMKRKHADAE